MLARATKKTVSRKTVLNVLGTLSTILTTARNWGYNCEQINLDKLRLQARGMKYEAPSFTPDQLKRILALDRKSTRLNSSHVAISYAVFCLKKKNNRRQQ